MGHIDDRARALKREAEEEASRRRQRTQQAAAQAERRLLAAEQELQAGRRREQDLRRQAAKQADPLISASRLRELMRDLKSTWGSGVVEEVSSQDIDGSVSTTIKLQHS